MTVSVATVTRAAVLIGNLSGLRTRRATVQSAQNPADFQEVAEFLSAQVGLINSARDFLTGQIDAQIAAAEAELTAMQIELPEA